MALSRDARLIARTRRGDVAAFEALHARHQPAVLSFCRHLTGSREDAEDAVQHTFLAAYRKIVESDERIDLRPWLYAVARNRCVSLLRARRERAVADPDAAAAAGLEGLAAEVERRQDLRDLVGDMARLPEEQRAALVLSQLDALSYREIGGVLGVEPAKVKALVFQARSSLTSTREAREAPCAEIRQEIATARGAGMRRRLLRRHVGQCDGCREFEVAMQRQRHQFDALLPALPSAGLAQAVLGGALGREGAAAGAGSGGAVAAAGGGGGLSGLVGAVGVGGATKLAMVAAVVAGGGVSAAVASDLPERLGGMPLVGGERGAAAEREAAVLGDEGAAGRGRRVAAPEDGRGERGPDDGPERGDERAAGDRGDTGDDEAVAGGERPDGPGESAAGEASGGGDLGAGDGSGESAGGSPPGLAKRGDDLPPGLAKRGGDLPPGLAKRVGGPPGQSGKQANPGRGNGAPPPGQAGAGHGNGNAGSGQGNGNGGGNGQGNGGAGQGVGQGNGNGAAGNANGQGNGGGAGAGGQGNGASGSEGSGPGGAQGNGNAGQGGGNGAAGNAGGQGNGSGGGGGKPK